MQIRKIELHNFQAHKRTVIEFDDGFNCVRGPTRAGKSSIVRALGFMLFDEWHDSYIRNGAQSVLVKLVLDDGTVVVREKGPNLNKIILTHPDGTSRTFEKFGVTAPPEVKQALKVYPAKIDTDLEVNLNLADQDEPPFLLSNSSFTKTKYLNRLTGVHIIDTALRGLNKDKLNLTSEKNQRRMTLEQLDDKLLKYKNVAAIQEKTEIAKERIENIEEKLNKYFKLKEVQDRLNVLKVREKQTLTFLNWYKTYQPRVENLKTKYNLFLQLRRLQLLLQKLNASERQIGELRIEEQELMKQFKVCPLCGQEMNSEVHLHQRLAPNT